MSPFDTAVFCLTGRFPSRWRSAFSWSLEVEVEGSCWVRGAEGAGTMNKREVEFLRQTQFFIIRVTDLHPETHRSNSAACL